MLRLMLPLALLSACGPLYSRVGPDGGTGGGSSEASGGGSSSSGGGTTAAGGGNVATGGGHASTGGGTAAPAFSFAAISIPDMQEAILTISGRPGDIYAATTFHVFHSTGGAFTEITGFPSKGFVGSYVAPDGAVFLATGRQLAVCKSDCTVAAHYTFELQDSQFNGWGLCGTGSSDVYAVMTAGDSPQTGTLRHYDGTSWTTLSTTIGADNARACAMDTNGDVWISANMGVVRYHAGAFDNQGPDLTTAVLPDEQPHQDFQAISFVDGWVHAAGWHRRIISRTPQGAWSLSYEPSSIGYLDAFYAVGGASADQQWAMGNVSTALNTNIVRFDGSAWNTAPNVSYFSYVRAVWAASDSEVWLAGETGQESTTVVVRATRN